MFAPPKAPGVQVDPIYAKQKVFDPGLTGAILNWVGLFLTLGFVGTPQNWPKGHSLLTPQAIEVPTAVQIPVIQVPEAQCESRLQAEPVGVKVQDPYNSLFPLV